ncbi:MAG: hypothetical protein U9Q03_03530 [Patescibacteria group bacterium]|nr:hypothetical protein [Patescibacteria group bacterium]
MMQSAWEFIKSILTVIGGLYVLLRAVNLFFGEVKKFNEIRARFLEWLLGFFRHRGLVKAAVASDIEQNVNEIVSDLQEELPLGWISRTSIKWVRDASAETLGDGEVIIRLRPLESQDLNFLTALNVFFQKSVYPKLKTVVPENVCKAVALKLSQRTINVKKPYLEDKYKEDVMEPIVQNDPSIASYIGRYEKIDEKGFFTGTFIRESSEIARRAQFKELRSSIDSELDSLLEHIEAFSQQISPGQQKRSEELWYREGPETSYAFLLVANPDRVGNAEPYINRAKVRAGVVERLYVFGASGQESFARTVISMIAALPEYELKEVFQLYRDYRGNLGGIGALLVSRKK